METTTACKCGNCPTGRMARGLLPFCQMPTPASTPADPALAVGHESWCRCRHCVATAATSIAATLKVGDRFTIEGYAACKVDNGTFEVCNLLEEGTENPELLYLRVVRGAATTRRDASSIRGSRRSRLARLEAAGFLRAVRS